MSKDTEIWRLKRKCNMLSRRLVAEGFEDVEWEVSSLVPPEPPAPEPSGLWACWNVDWLDIESPSIGTSTTITDESYQLPADMPAAEIARLTVGDCRRMKGE